VPTPKDFEGFLLWRGTSQKFKRLTYNRAFLIFVQHANRKQEIKNLKKFCDVQESRNYRYCPNKREHPPFPIIARSFPTWKQNILSHFHAAKMNDLAYGSRFIVTGRRKLFYLLLSIWWCITKPWPLDID